MAKNLISTLPYNNSASGILFLDNPDSSTPVLRNAPGAKPKPLGGCDLESLNRCATNSPCQYTTAKKLGRDAARPSLAIG